MNALRTIAASLLFAAATASAAWPEKPIKVYIGYAAGGSTDVVARLLAPKLGEKLGQPVVIENKPGGAGDFAAELMLQAPADGYTLMMSTVALHAINPGLFKQKFDPIHDFSLIAMVCSYPMIMIGSPQTSFKTIADLKALAEKAPTFCSSSGVGSPGHLAGELLVKATGANLTHVPYKGGGQAMSDALGGNVPLVFTAVAGAIQHLKQNRLVAIAVSSEKRSPSLPDVPTFIEAGVPGFEATSWVAVLAPAKTPRAVIEKLNRELNAVLTDPVIVDKLGTLGIAATPGTPEQLTEQMRADLAKYWQVVKAANINAE